MKELLMIGYLVCIIPAYYWIKNIYKHKHIVWCWRQVLNFIGISFLWPIVVLAVVSFMIFMFMEKILASEPPKWL